MQAFQRAAAVFCMACIGAELVGLFAGQSWAGRCIKAVAGLYILAVLLAQLPHLPGRVLTAFSGNTAPAALSAAQSDALETEILTGAETRLEDSLQQTIRQIWGTETGLQIRLTSDGTAAQAQQVWVEFRPECSAEMQEQILNFLEQELGTRPERQEGV